MVISLEQISQVYDMDTSDLSLYYQLNRQMEYMQRNIEQKGRIVYEIYKTKPNKPENNYGEK